MDSSWAWGRDQQLKAEPEEKKGKVHGVIRDNTGMWI